MKKYHDIRVIFQAIIIVVTGQAKLFGLRIMKDEKKISNKHASLAYLWNNLSLHYEFTQELRSGHCKQL